MLSEPRVSPAVSNHLAAEETTTKLAWLAVSNYDETSGHRFDVRVERDGEVVHESTHTVGKKPEDRIPGAVADCTWNDVAGRYVVFARMDDGDWTERSLTEEFDRVPECVTAEVRYWSGSLAVWVQDWCDQVDGYVGGCPAYKTPMATGRDANDSTG